MLYPNKNSFHSTPFYFLSSCLKQSQPIGQFSYTITWEISEETTQLNLSLSASETIGSMLRFELPQEFIDAFCGVSFTDSWCFDEADVLTYLETGEGYILVDIARTDCQGQDGEGLFLSLIFDDLLSPIQIPSETNRLGGVIVMIDDVS